MTLSLFQNAQRAATSSNAFLFQALRGLDWDGIVRALSLGADVDFQDPVTGRTVLMEAARAGRKDVISLCEAHFADPDLFDANGDRAYGFACLRFDEALVRQISSLGGGPNYVNLSGESPFALVMERTLEDDKDLKCKVDVLREILASLPQERQQEEVDRKNADGDTSLMRACRSQRNYAELTQFLFDEANANPNCKNNKGETLVKYAIDLDRFGNTQYFRPNRCDLNAPCDGDETPLLRAIRLDKESIFNSLVRARVRLNHRGKGGVFPLLLALRLDRADMVRPLVEGGASISLCDEEGQTVFLEAARKSPADCFWYMRELVLGDPSENLINARDTEGKTALMRLVEKPLSEEDEKCVLSALGVLLSYKADIFIRTPEGESALSLACKAGRKLAADFLRSKGAKDESEIRTASRVCFVRAGGASSGREDRRLFDLLSEQNVFGLRRMLCRGLSPNVRDKNGVPLLVAAQKFDAKDMTIEILHDPRTDLNLCDPDGNTALFYLLQHKGKCCWESAEQFLMDLRTDVNFVNKKGVSLFSILSEINDNTACAFYRRAIVDRKADPNLRIGPDNKTLLMEAVSRRPDLVEALLKRPVNFALQDDFGNTVFSLARERGIEHVFLKVREEMSLWRTSRQGRWESAMPPSLAGGPA